MLLILFLFIIPFVSCYNVVQTNSGPIRGISSDTNNVEAFLGIPYAEPPVGNLRFAKPIPKSPWTETLHAKEFPPACVQCMMKMFTKFLNESVKMDEDCLFLNLWVPKSETILKPVMVYIHGGGFMAGTASVKIFDGAALSHHGDVIVASMNYRVGTLGFFSAFIDEAAGSMGMYDQLLAFQWIKDNAKHFGGDPDNIVIFGESAGSWSVSMHLISPLSKKLFNRAILQSGSSVHPMFPHDNKLLRMGSLTVSKLTGCAVNDEELNENPKYVVECMKNLTVEKIAKVDEVLYKKLAMLVPRIGDEFLPKDPTDSYRGGEFKDTEVLIGMTRDEGSMFLAFHNFFKNDGMNRVDFEFADMFAHTFEIDAFDETSAKEMTQPLAVNEQYAEIIQTYFRRVKENSRYTYLDAVSDIMGDSFITCSTVFHADFQSFQSHPVYFYVFDYRSPTSPFPEWMGVPHFEEVQYVFGFPFLKALFTEHEKELSKDMMDMWVAFAKTGNPNIPGGLKWPKYTYENPKYLNIGMRDRVGVKPDNYRCEAWRKVYRSLIDEKVFQNLQ